MIGASLQFLLDVAEIEARVEEAVNLVEPHIIVIVLYVEIAEFHQQQEVVLTEFHLAHLPDKIELWIVLHQHLNLL